MASAATARSRSARGLGFIFSLMCLLCFANSVQVKERLEEMREQLTKVEQLIEFWKTNVESERKNTFEVMYGNVERMKCIRKHSLAAVHQMEDMEENIDQTNTHVKKSFTNMAAKIQEMESRLEDMKAQLRFAEHFSA